VKILVVGAGAVGSLLAARLSATGNLVELTGRPEHVAAIRAHGLQVEGPGGGTFELTALSTLDDATAPEVVLLTVKTFDLSRAAVELALRFPVRVPTVLLQNGLNIERLVVEPLLAANGEDPTPWLVRAVNSIPGTLVGPGVVRKAGDGEVVLRDPGAGGPAAAATEKVRAVLSDAGIRVRLVHDLERELWRKVLVNAAINPVTALHQVTNGRLLESPYREEAATLLREAQRAEAAAGYFFSDAEADGDLDHVLRATAANRSSMLQDRDRGRRTEVDAISGEILRAAAAHGIELAATRSVLERIRNGFADPAGRA
jgi:2-dehydropantoate 2-reductase